MLGRRRKRPPERAAGAVRREYAQLLRQFLSGRMPNKEYQRRCEAIIDRGDTPDAVQVIYNAAWHLYRDIRTHRMTGDRRPTPALRRRIARWVAFLYSDAPYESAPSEPRQGALIRVADAFDALYWLSFLIAWIAAASLLALGFERLGLMFGAVVLALWVAGLGWSGLTGWGVSLDSAVRRAFSEDKTDPWPFASAADLCEAIARPRLLAGQTAVPADAHDPELRQ